MPDRAVEVLLVGGGVASVRCARALRRNGFGGSILLVAEEPRLPYNRPPLSKEVLRGDVPADLLLVEGADWYERRSIEVRTGLAASRIVRDQRFVELDDGSTIGYGQLLLATGATPRIPAIRGVERARTLRTIDDAIGIRSSVNPGMRIVIVGGGFIGVEAAASLAAVGAEVTLVEVSERLWGGSLGDDLSAWAERSLIGDGVAIRLGAAVTEIRDTAVVIGADSVRSYLTVVCVGVAPRDELGRAAGLPVDDGIVTDAGHQTADPHIFAAGDAARVDGRRVEHWHSAREGGERAAASMLGSQLADPRAPWIFSDFGDRHLEVLGMSGPADRSEVAAAVDGRPAVVAWIASDDRIVRLAVTDGAIPAEVARNLVESGARLPDLHRYLYAMR